MIRFQLKKVLYCSLFPNSWSSYVKSKKEDRKRKQVIQRWLYSISDHSGFQEVALCDVSPSEATALPGRRLSPSWNWLSSRLDFYPLSNYFQCEKSRTSGERWCYLTYAKKQNPKNCIFNLRNILCPVPWLQVKSCQITFNSLSWFLSVIQSEEVQF